MEPPTKPNIIKGDPTTRAPTGRPGNRLNTRSRSNITTQYHPTQQDCVGRIGHVDHISCVDHISSVDHISCVDHISHVGHISCVGYIS
jgi:hypothetical protein